jgi:histidyl-tRNA synthetase
VRGIDYYTKTVFEVWQEGIGAQAALCGGGRYDGLAEDIGGPATPGVGFGSGIERIVLGMKEQEIEPPAAANPPVFIAHFGGETKTAAVTLSYLLRDAGIGTRLAFARDRRSMKSQMREANRQDARFVLIIGEEELANNQVVVRPLDGGEQSTLARSDVAGWMADQMAR